MTSALTDSHARTSDACLLALDTRPEGLTRAEAARRLAEHGPNRLPEVRGRGPVLRFLNVLIYVLLGAAVVTATLQHWVDTWPWS